MEIYTDGSCIGNPGPGGSAFVCVRDGTVCFGVYECGPDITTNNRMELQAVIDSLGCIPTGESVTIWTDSNYVLQGVTSWSKTWIKNGWKNSKKEPVANKELWLTLLNKMKTNPKVKLSKVKAHVGVEFNELADKLAKKGALRR